MERLSLDEIRTRCKELIAEHLDSSWAFRFDNAKRRMGACFYNSHIISVSKNYALINDWDTTKDTVLHEIAHALVGEEHSHDEVWQAMAQKIGANPDYKKVSINRPKPNYFASCPNCGREFSKYRIKRFGNYYCSDCCEKVEDKSKALLEFHQK